MVQSVSVSNVDMVNVLVTFVQNVYCVVFCYLNDALCTVYPGLCFSALGESKSSCEQQTHYLKMVSLVFRWRIGEMWAIITRYLPLCISSNYQSAFSWA